MSDDPRRDPITRALRSCDADKRSDAYYERRVSAVLAVLPAAPVSQEDPQ
jgi:hypothetical protein